MECYSCGAEAGSLEHIINNSIGGKIKSKELLCNSCNKQFGTTIDTELDKRIGYVGDLLGIERDRGKSTPTIVMKSDSGKIKHVGPFMRPLFKFTFPAGGTTRDQYVPEAKAPKFIKKKQAELTKNGEKVIFVESTEIPTKEKWRVWNKYTTDENNVKKIGSRLFYRCIAKIVVNYFLYRGYNKKDISEAIAFVKDQKEDSIHFYYYPTNYIIHDLNKDEISHIIHIRGDKVKRVLYAYVELFNYENSLVILNLNYDGEDFTDTYCWDLLNNKVIEKKIVIRLIRQHFLDLHLMSYDFQQRYTEKYDRVMRIIENRQIMQ